MRGRAAAPSPAPRPPQGRAVAVLAGRLWTPGRAGRGSPCSSLCPPGPWGPAHTYGGLGEGSGGRSLGCASHLWALCNHPLAWRGRNGLFLNQNTFFYYYCYGFYFFSLSELPGVCIYKYLYI